MSVPGDQELRTQRRELVQLKAKLSQLLDGPLPGNFADGVKLLENHLYEGLAERGDKFPVTFSVTAEDLGEYSGLVREIAAEKLLDSQSDTLGGLSPCDIAVAEGLALITAGSFLGAHAALIGFGIGVYLLTQHCGEGD